MKIHRMSLATFFMDLRIVVMKVLNHCEDNFADDRMENGYETY